MHSASVAFSLQEYEEKEIDQTLSINDREMTESLFLRKKIVK